MVVGQIIKGVGIRFSKAESSALYFAGREVSSVGVEDLCRIFVFDSSKREGVRRELSNRMDSAELIQRQIRYWVRHDPNKLERALA